MFLIVIVQAVSAVPPERIGPPQPPLSCELPDDKAAEIVVCASRRREQSPYRIIPPEAEQSALPKAQIKLADRVNASADTETADVGGFASKRAMIRLKIGF